MAQDAASVMNADAAEDCERLGRAALAAREYERAVRFLSRALRLNARAARAAELLAAAKRGCSADPNYCGACYKFRRNCTCGYGAAPAPPTGHNEGARRRSTTPPARPHAPPPRPPPPRAGGDAHVGGLGQQAAVQWARFRAWLDVKAVQLQHFSNGRIAAAHVPLLLALLVAALLLGCLRWQVGQPLLAWWFSPHGPDHHHHYDGGDGFARHRQRPHDFEQRGAPPPGAGAGYGAGWGWGALPGDISWRSVDGTASFHFPIVTCILFSAALNFLCNRRR